MSQLALSIPDDLVVDLAIEHLCHAAGCSRRVQPRFLMCYEHWWLVSTNTRAAVDRLCRPGQWRDKRPSADYMVVAHRAISEVALFEHREDDARSHEVASQRWLERTSPTPGMGRRR